MSHLLSDKRSDDPPHWLLCPAGRRSKRRSSWSPRKRVFHYDQCRTGRRSIATFHALIHESGWTCLWLGPGMIDQKLINPHVSDPMISWLKESYRKGKDTRVFGIKSSKDIVSVTLYVRSPGKELRVDCFELLFPNHSRWTVLWFSSKNWKKKNESICSLIHTVGILQQEKNDSGVRLQINKIGQRTWKQDSPVWKFDTWTAARFWRISSYDKGSQWLPAWLSPSNPARCPSRVLFGHMKALSSYCDRINITKEGLNEVLPLFLRTGEQK